MASKKTSGTVWSEDQIKERWESLKLRLHPGYKARIEAMAEAAGLSIGGLVESWIDAASAALKKTTGPKK